MNKLGYFIVSLFTFLVTSQIGFTQTYSTPGTYNWLCPPGVNSITVECWGGGGGGGGLAGKNGQAAGGGAGGGYVRYTNLIVSPGTAYTIVVGAGGTAGTSVTSATAGINNGGLGGSSSFNAVIIAAGGGGGQGTGSTTADLSGTKGAKGTNSCTGCDVNNQGGDGGAGTFGSNSGAGGGSAGSSGIGGDASGSTAGAAGAGGGVIGAAGRTSSFNGIDGGSPGAGGSGAYTAGSNRPGGAGGAGQVKITINTPSCIPLFEQNFSNTTYTNYSNTDPSPNFGQFNEITSSSTAPSITSNKLRFNRSNGSGTHVFSRITDFSVSGSAPTSLICQFKLTVSGNSSATVGAAAFRIGDGMAADGGTATDGQTHSRLAISHQATAGQYKLRSGSTDGSNTYSGEQSIFWVINNSGSTLTYRAPDGTNESIANDTWDVWVGTTKEFNDQAAITATKNLTDIKFALNSGTAVYDLDDISIDPIPSIPTSSAATSITSSGFTANWNSVSCASSYLLDVSTSSTFASFVSGYNDLDVGNVTSYNVTGLAASTTYYYRVRTKNTFTVGSFTSGSSATQNLTTLSSCTPTANAGAALSAICQSGTSAAMGGSVGGSATGGTWLGGSGTWSNANDPANATYTAASNESGTITLTLTTSGGSCGTSTATKNITVNINLSFDGVPVNDTVYNELGNASFGVSLAIPSGATYQWQVSTNNGSTWTNLSNGSFYTGVTDSILQITNPTYSMNGYLYRCLATNFCGTINSGSGAILNVIQLSTFSNTTSTSCGTNFSNTWGTFERTITVSGLPTPLGTSSGQYVLRQIDLKLGNSLCKKNLKTYQARIISPNGTIIELFDNDNSANITVNPIWMDIKFRDHESLERLEQYTTTVQTFYFPYSIGYYAIQNDGDFNNLIGENPNGDWRLQIIENTTDEISFESVRLYFGPNFSVNNITSSTANDICSNAACISSQEIVIGTNNGYDPSDPLFPGTTTGSCEWNGFNNNSAWFKFVASQSTAYLTLSGIRAVNTGPNDTQPIVFSMTNPCASGYAVPTGGCPDDESINNSVYRETNGGGIVTSGNVYSNGITANAEFNLSGLTVGQTYYLYVDGSGGASSSFYIEMAKGAQTCRTLLPVELSVFKASYVFPFAHLTWRTESELNNDRFEIEKSIDGINWKYLTSINGNGTKNTASDYNYVDEEIIETITYYRLKQIDYNGEFSYSSIEKVDPLYSESSMFYPNPSSDKIYINSMVEFGYKMMDQLGRIVQKGINPAGVNYISIKELDAGIYFLVVNGNYFGKLIKQYFISY